MYFVHLCVRTCTHAHTLPHVKPEINCTQLATEGGSTFVRGWLQLTGKDGSPLVRGLPQSTR